MYTTEIDLNFDTVADLLACGLEMEVPSIVRLCLDYLSQVTLQNCLHFYAIATKHGLTDLKKKILTFIGEHTEELETGPEYANLSLEVIVQFIKCLKF